MKAVGIGVLAVDVDPSRGVKGCVEEVGKAVTGGDETLAAVDWRDDDGCGISIGWLWE